MLQPLQPLPPHVISRAIGPEVMPSSSGSCTRIGWERPQIACHRLRASIQAWRGWSRPLIGADECGIVDPVMAMKIAVLLRANGVCQCANAENLETELLGAAWN
jgi:hypothetical protein